MILSIEELIKLLRDSVNVQYAEDNVEDSAYLTMTDEDILRYIKLGVNRVYPNIDDLEDLPSDCSEYAIILLSKIELYLKLAVTKVDKVDLGADSAYIKNSQRFDHYMRLVEEARQEYESWLDSEGNGTVTTYEVLSSKYSHTKRNYEHQLTPIVRVKATNVTSDCFDLIWNTSNISHFGKYAVYLSKSPIYSPYASGSKYESHINQNDDLVLLRSTYDFRNNTKHISGLKPDTDYYIFVVAQCRNGVWGGKEVCVSTLEEVSEGEEIDVNIVDNTPTS